MCTQTLQGAANAFDQTFKLFWNQFDRHEQFSQSQKLLMSLFAATTVLLQGLEGNRHLIGDRTEALRRNDRIRTAFGLFLVVAIGRLFVVIVSGFSLFGFLIDRWRYLGWRRDAVVRIDITAQNVGQATTFGGNAGVFGENVLDRTREVRDCAHHFTDAFLDTLGDFDFAFACQKLDRTHFTHIHAHRVGRATDVGFDCRQRCGCFFSGRFVGVSFGQQKGVRIRSTLEYVDPHVVNHADDVFHLFRI